MLRSARCMAARRLAFHWRVTQHRPGNSETNRCSRINAFNACRRCPSTSSRQGQGRLLFHAASFRRAGQQALAISVPARGYWLEQQQRCLLGRKPPPHCPGAEPRRQLANQAWVRSVPRIRHRKTLGVRTGIDEPRLHALADRPDVQRRLSRRQSPCSTTTC
jgi:hypothetical protein